jgi:uncharacterized protein (DUF433 family)
MALISADPQVMHGQAVIAGTRVPVSVILDCLAALTNADDLAGVVSILQRGLLRIRHP